jgi:hypothetical protein
VTFRDNRATVWSLTQHGTVLNVHAAYASATPRLLDAFATIAKEGGVRSRASRQAAQEVAEWPKLEEAIRKAREAYRTASGDARPPTHCCATPEQRAYLRALYRYFNRTRFGGRLPDGIPVRLSRRMRSSLGPMLPAERSDGARYVAEIALNVDLLLAGNGAERIDTLLHEMAHAADYLTSGARGHGPSWRRWARQAGCQPTTLYDRPVVTRHRRSMRVTRVPPLPPGLVALTVDATDSVTDGLDERHRRVAAGRDMTDQAGHSQPKVPATSEA